MSSLLSRSYDCLRTIAPAGNFAPVAQLPKQLTTSGDIPLREQLGKRFAVPHVVLAGSGTAALYSLFRHLKAERGCRNVAIAEFTCPEVAAAAIRAGLQLVLAPLNHQTLSGDWSALTAQPDIILLSNLYGLPEALPDRQLFSKSVIIDDACQSALSAEHGHFVGNRGADFGVISFGRGKAFCGFGGGAIIDPHMALPEQKRSDTEAPHKLAQLWPLIWLKQLAMSFLERPHIYSLPASIPFLGLGETNYNEEFSLENLSAAQIYAALAQLNFSQELRPIFRNNCEHWGKLLGKALLQPFNHYSPNPEATPIRYPILFPNVESRQQAIKRLRKFGISQSYAKTLFDFPEISPFLSQTGLRQASAGGIYAAHQLATLPVHRFVTPSDCEKVASSIQEIIDKYRHG